MMPTVYKIEGPWPGQLMIVARPLGGDWLEDEVEGWRNVGIDVVVSALEASERDELGLNMEEELCRDRGLTYIAFPIPDRGMPATSASVLEVARRLEQTLRDGRNVAIHCRQGIGRSSMIAASVLGVAGVASRSAFERIAKARGCAVPDTKEQREWVVGLFER